MNYPVSGCSRLRYQCPENYVILDMGHLPCRGRSSVMQQAVATCAGASLRPWDATGSRALAPRRASVYSKRAKEQRWGRLGTARWCRELGRWRCAQRKGGESGEREKRCVGSRKAATDTRSGVARVQRAEVQGALGWKTHESHAAAVGILRLCNDGPTRA